MLLVSIVGIVLVVRRLPQPYRGIIDVGVVFGLGWGLVALAAFAWAAVVGSPPRVSPGSRITSLHGRRPFSPPYASSVLPPPRAASPETPDDREYVLPVGGLREERGGLQRGRLPLAVRHRRHDHDRDRSQPRVIPLDGAELQPRS